MKADSGTDERPATVDMAIARVVRDELRKLNVHSQRMLSRSEAAKHLGCSEGTIDNLVGQGKLHPARYMRLPTFDVFDLEKLIEDSKNGSYDKR